MFSSLTRRTGRLSLWMSFRINLTSILSHARLLKIKFITLSALFAGAAAFAPSTTFTRSTALFAEDKHLGAGGMADTRDPNSFAHEDPRKSISAAPTFEEYMKMKNGDTGATEEPKAEAGEATLGAGGMADTRDPETHQDDDPRKSISAAPTFEEYMKSKAAGN